MTFGTIIPGLKIHGKDAPYPVVNERAVRAGAGIMFLLAMIGFMNAFLTKNYIFLDIFVVLFFTEFVIRQIHLPFAPISRLANWLVRKQKPEYVGAVQKRFAWGIGLLLASTMMLLIYGFAIRGPANLSICLVCLTFLWLESALGFCAGCKIYGLLHNKKWFGFGSEPKAACPGNVCAVNITLPKKK